jgi:predicted NACHT family NTPase
MPLDEAHIDRMIRQAYAAIYREDPAARQAKADELLDGIRKLEDERRRRLGKEVERLVSSPLLVRMLLVVHFSERRMPEQRAELYMRATDAMLLPEYAPDEATADRIGRLVGGSRELHRDLVQHLAFAMHRRGPTQGREIQEDDLRRVLKDNPAYAGLVDDLIGLTRLRGTLLEERLGAYRFIHLAFQEYLAARYLAEIVGGGRSDWHCRFPRKQADPGQLVAGASPVGHRLSERYLAANGSIVSAAARWPRQRGGAAQPKTVRRRADRCG